MQKLKEMKRTDDDIVWQNSLNIGQCDYVWKIDKLKNFMEMKRKKTAECGERRRRLLREKKEKISMDMDRFVKKKIEVKGFLIFLF